MDIEIITKRAITALGGPAKVARLCDCTTQAVSQWKYVPTRLVPRVWDALRRAGYCDVEPWHLNSSADWRLLRHPHNLACPEDQ